MNKINLPKQVIEMAQAFPITTEVHQADDGGFWIESPQLGGCFASGDNTAEAMHNYKLAIFEYFEIPEDFRNPDRFKIEVLDLPDEKKTKKPFIATLIPSRDYAFN